MGLGGIAVQPHRLKGIEADIAEINKRMNYTSEVKWEKARERRDDIYMAYIQLLATLVHHKQIHFHMRFSPIAEYDHKDSGPRGHADTVSKAFYQLFLHRPGRYYSRTCDIHVRPDGGSCTEYLPKTIAGLNADICIHHGRDRHCVRTIQPCDSTKEPILQLLDVTLGGLTCLKNGNHENGVVAPYKAGLAVRTAEVLGISNIHASTHMNERVLNVWNVTPKYKKGAAPKR